MIDTNLVKAINSGHCVPIIGAGLSCEIGLPTWKDMAKKAISFAKNQIVNFNDSKASSFFSKEMYAEVFSEILNQDSENVFNDWLKQQFEKPLPIINNSIYDQLCDWPFNFYITTNYDHAIERYLRSHSLPFIEKLNFKEDFDLLRVGSKNLIFKIHGDFSNTNSIVLTKRQYESIIMDANKCYWRDKLFAVLSVMDVLILGYSLNDPDFNEQVERAKSIAGPNHPIYMFATGLSTQEINSTKIVHLFFFANNTTITFPTNQHLLRQKHPKHREQEQIKTKIILGTAIA